MTTATTNATPNEFGLSVVLGPAHSHGDFIDVCARMMAKTISPVIRIGNTQQNARHAVYWKDDAKQELIVTAGFDSDRKWTMDEILATDDVRTPEELEHWDTLGRFPLEVDPFWSDVQLAALGARQDQRDAEYKAIEAVISAEITTKLREVSPEITLEAT